MSITFEELMNPQNNRLDEVNKSFENRQTTSFVDEKQWSPSPDALGNYSGIIRFLPPPPGETLDVVSRFNHGYKNPKTGKWFIHNCPTTIGRPCPICEANTELWNTGDSEKRAIVSNPSNADLSRKRKQSFYANILVVNDPACPENNGKVFIYRFGVKIKEKIEAKTKPESKLEIPVNIFHFINGADFMLNISKGNGGYTTYDKSYFMNPAPLFGGDQEKIRKVWESQHSLREYIDESQFLSYDELKAAFDLHQQVVGSGTRPPQAIQEAVPVAASPPIVSVSPVSASSQAPFVPTNTPPQSKPSGGGSPLDEFRALLGD